MTAWPCHHCNDGLDQLALLGKLAAGPHDRSRRPSRSSRLARPWPSPCMSPFLAPPSLLGRSPGFGAPRKKGSGRSPVRVALRSSCPREARMLSCRHGCIQSTSPRRPNHRARNARRSRLRSDRGGDRAGTHRARANHQRSQPFCSAGCQPGATAGSHFSPGGKGLDPSCPPSRGARRRAATTRS